MTGLSDPEHAAHTSEAFAAAYQIIAHLAAEAGLFSHPQVVVALNYYAAAANGDVQSPGSLLPFAPEKNGAGPS